MRFGAGVLDPYHMPAGRERAGDLEGIFGQLEDETGCRCGPRRRRLARREVLCRVGAAVRFGGAGPAEP